MPVEVLHLIMNQMDMSSLAKIQACNRDFYQFVTNDRRFI